MGNNKLKAVKEAVFFAKENPLKLANIIHNLITDVVTKVVVAGDSSVTIGGSTVTKTYTATPYSQYSDLMTGTATFALASGAPTGVSINSSTGVLSVTSSAVAGTAVVEATISGVKGTKSVSIVTA